jgi:CheY-like chemotaxis protein
MRVGCFATETKETNLSLLQCARRLAHRRRIPIISLTGSLRHEEILAADAAAFLNKPTGLKELIPTCYGLLGVQNGNGRDTGELHESVGNGSR